MTPLFDPDRFRALATMSADDEHRLLHLYLDNQARLLATLRGGLATDALDFEALRRAAHRLKSGARSVGADPLVDTCIRIEQACTAESTASAREAIDLAVDQASGVDGEIRRHLDDTGA